MLRASTKVSPSLMTPLPPIFCSPSALFPPCPPRSPVLHLRQRGGFQGKQLLPQLRQLRHLPLLLLSLPRWQPPSPLMVVALLLLPVLLLLVKQGQLLSQLGHLEGVMVMTGGGGGEGGREVRD